MSKDSFDYSDLDAILAEFRDASEPPAPAAEPVLPEPEYSPEPSAPPIVEARAPELPEEPAFELPPLYTREEEEQRRADAEKTRLLQTPSKDFLKSAGAEAPKKAPKPFRPAKAEKPVIKVQDSGDRDRDRDKIAALPGRERLVQFVEDGRKQIDPQQQIGIPQVSAGTALYGDADQLFQQIVI